MTKSATLTRCLWSTTASTPEECRKALYQAVQVLDEQREHIGAVICSDDFLHQLANAFGGDTTYDRIVASRTLVGAPLGIDDTWHGARVLNVDWTVCATVNYVKA